MVEVGNTQDRLAVQSGRLWESREGLGTCFGAISTVGTAVEFVSVVGSVKT